ncbi:agmatinase [Ahniella affigens]|nr:agmatinase [Ahniella affigens]
MSQDPPSWMPARIDQAWTRASPYGTQSEPTFSGTLSFLRRRYSKDLTGVDVAVFGVPFDLATTNRPGARFGPRAMREASASLAWCQPYAWPFDPLDRLHVIDYGDLLIDAGKPDTIPAQIESQVAPMLAAGVLPLALGGDHFVSLPLLRALAKHHGALSLVHFDAHSDTWAEAEFRIDHGSMFYHAAREGVVAPQRSIQLGMRTHHAETHGYEVWHSPMLHERGIAEAIAAIHQRVGNSPCYVSVDIDFLDPAYAPGTGTPVCGGFNTHQALSLIRGLAGLNVVGMDVVEVAPAYDHAMITALAGASIAQELLAVVASTRPDR